MLNKNTIWFGSVLLLTIALGACKKDKKPELVRLADHVDFTIQPGLNTFDTHIYTIGPKQSFYKAQLAATGHSEDEVSVVQAYAASLSGIFSEENLDFIHQVSVLIYDPQDPSNRIEFFYNDPVPFKYKTRIDLFPGIADIREWMERDYYGIEIRLNFRQVTPSLIQMRLDFETSVRGN